MDGGQEHQMLVKLITGFLAQEEMQIGKLSDAD